MSNEIMRREIQEAVQAGERALASLHAAQEKLGSARNWGLVDLFGGGFFTDMMKHSRINQAVSCMETAKADLHVFQRELRDVSVISDLHLEIGSFLTFADFFFDGVVADYFVQSRIADARNQVEDAISRVEYVLADLNRYLK